MSPSPRAPCSPLAGSASRILAFGWAKALMTPRSIGAEDGQLRTAACRPHILACQDAPARAGAEQHKPIRMIGERTYSSTPTLKAHVVIHRRRPNAAPAFRMGVPRSQGLCRCIAYSDKARLQISPFAPCSRVHFGNYDIRQSTNAGSLRMTLAKSRRHGAPHPHPPQLLGELAEIGNDRNRATACSPVPRRKLEASVPTPTKSDFNRPLTYCRLNP